MLLLFYLYVGYLTTSYQLKSLRSVKRDEKLIVYDGVREYRGLFRHVCYSRVRLVGITFSAIGVH